MKTFAIDPSMWTIVAGHVIVTTPFVILIVGARLRNYDVTVEQAARDLGAHAADGPAQDHSPAGRALDPGRDGGRVRDLLRRGADHQLHLGDDARTLPLFVLSRLHRTIDPSVNAIAAILLASCPGSRSALTLLVAADTSVPLGRPPRRAEELARAA